MDPNRIDRHLTNKINQIQRNIDAEKRADDVPIEDYDRQFFKAEISYGDSVLLVKVITCFERLRVKAHDVAVDSQGPWIIFRVLDVLDGDPEGMIDIGAAIMARWNSQQKTYTKYIYKADPEVTDKEVITMAALSFSTTEEEIVKGQI